MAVYAIIPIENKMAYIGKIHPRHFAPLAFLYSSAGMPFLGELQKQISSLTNFTTCI